MTDTIDQLADLIKNDEAINVKGWGLYMMNNNPPGNFRHAAGKALVELAEYVIKRQLDLVPKPPQPEAPSHRLLVGVHGRNDKLFYAPDYEAIKTARIEVLKMMSQTLPGVFAQIKAENPDMLFITRLYDDRFGTDHHPHPAEFAARMVKVMEQLKPYCTMFEVHNEPNHEARYEGWGKEDHHAESFNKWFLEVYDFIKDRHPWAELGFPGLAIPHNDLRWIDICRPAIERADWLGVHCYWQTPRHEPRNHLVDFWGLRFKYYHDKYPDKDIHITECGNSNIQAAPPIAISEDDLAKQYVDYVAEVGKYDYVKSVAYFILSSQDPNWDFFTWRKEDGRLKPVVRAMGER